MKLTTQSGNVLKVCAASRFSTETENGLTKILVSLKGGKKLYHVGTYHGDAAANTVIDEIQGAIESQFKSYETVVDYHGACIYTLEGEYVTAFVEGQFEAKYNDNGLGRLVYYPTPASEPVIIADDLVSMWQVNKLWLSIENRLKHNCKYIVVGALYEAIEDEWLARNNHDNCHAVAQV